MITNQSQDANRGLRLYGQNERASSTSSGPKWTSSITDLLVNRGGAPSNAANQMRYKNNSGANAGMVVSQSHQTSQHQLLAHQQAAPSSSAQHLHNISGSGPQTSEGSRLMMKLMNNAVIGNTQHLSTHHQPSISSMSGIPPAGSTFDHPRLSGSRDDQKRLALDECTNYLQQKTMQQHFPSTSMAISNIINSNRSASSAGIQAQQQQQQQQPSGSSTSAAAKKFQAFKFNLTLNKNKALGSNKDQQQMPLQNQQQYSSNAFYQAQQMAEQQMQDQEDNDAIVISEKHKKQIQALSRGSSQLAMKQHLKQMIKSYEDQPQLNTDGTQRFDYHQTQQIPQTDQQLTYDNALRSNINPSGQTLQQPPTQTNARMAAPGSASSSSKGKPIEKKVHEMEERQKIFEEEIIKRVKEIQTYAKTLHMHLKKLQQSQNKKTEDHQILKDEVTLQIKDLSDIVQQRNHYSTDVSEQKVNDMVEKRLKILDSEITLQIEHLEQKLVKDYDAKFARLTKNTQSELQLKTETLRDEIFEEISQSIKADMRQITDKLNKSQEKAQSDFNMKLNQTQSLLESNQQALSKDLSAKQEKLSKLIKDTQTNSDETIAAMSEAIRNEMEQMKKKIQGELKNEIAKMQQGEREIKEQIDLLEQKIDKIEGMLEKQGSPQKTPQNSTSTGMQRQEIQTLINELQESLEDQIGQVANEFSEHVKLQQSKNDQIKSIQEAYLQLKQHQSSTTLSINEKQTLHDSQIRQSNAQIEQLRLEIDEVKQALQSQDDTKIDPDNITDQVLDQVKPDIDNLNEVTAQITQQVEELKLQLTSKCQKVDLQELKQDVNANLQQAQKQLELKLTEVEAQVSSLHGDLDSLVDSSKNLKIELNERISQLKQTMTQLSADIKSKTDDLYDQLKEQEERIGNGQQQSFLQNTSQQESTPERKSRVEALAALRASLENQINDINERIDNMIETRAGDKNDSKTAIKALQNQLQEISPQITGKLDSLIDDKLDDTFAKVNELDARISKIEEKSFESPDKHKHQQVGLTAEEIDEKIQSAQNDLQSAVDTAMDQLTEFESKLEQIQDQRKKEVDNLKFDIQSLRELNTCLQDVMVTQEDYSKFKANFIQPESLQAKLDEMKEMTSQINSEIAGQIDGLKETAEGHEERIKVLERRKFVQEKDQEINFLSSPRQIEHQRAQGHFLEDLSEAISSPNHQTNRTGTEGGDMLLFNNQTQSVGRNSMMSNRLANLVSPIVDRNFQFNSQVSGIAPRVLLETTPSAAPNHQQQTIDIDDDNSSEDKEEGKNQEGEDDAYEELEDQSHQDVFEKESPLKEEPQIQKESSSSEQQEEDEDEEGNNPAVDEDLMQEINISLESPREEEKGHTPERKANEILNHRSINSTSANRQQLQQPTHAKLSPVTPVQVQEDEKSQEFLSDQEGVGSEFERGESMEESEEDKKESDKEEQKQPNNQPSTLNHNLQLFSPPTSQVAPVPNPVHHALGTQSNHFVAFESDEEDVQQYDLLPISNAPVNSRNNQGGPHGTSSQAAVIPAAPHHHHAVRNRYYESGSGDEEQVQQPNEEEVDVDGQQLDNFNVQFQERNQYEEVDREEENLPEELVSQREEAVNEEEQDAEFDDSPFDAASGQRFDQRFEDESDVRRPITSLASRNIREQLEEDPEIQHIHHETLSSHRTSEMSENNQPDVDISRRSGSPNLDHNNDNILGQEEEEQNPLPLDLEESKIDPVIQSQSFLDPLDDLRTSNVQQREAPVGIQKSEGGEDDDWNLEDVTERKDVDQSSDEQDCSDKHQSQQDNEEETYKHSLEEETKGEEGENRDMGLKSQIVANWIIENEIAKCIEAALSLRSRTWQHDDLNQSEEEGMAEW